MQRSRLLIVDGESLRTPGLVKILEREGWDQEWITGQSGSHRQPAGGPPDLVMFDPTLVSSEGLHMIASLRLRHPALRGVILGRVGQADAVLSEAGLDPATVTYLDRNLSVEAWPAALRSNMGGFGAISGKFTAEDLFGDILAEIMEPSAAAVPESAFTLSDLPGIQDPFSSDLEPAPAIEPSAPRLAARPPAPEPHPLAPPELHPLAPPEPRPATRPEPRPLAVPEPGPTAAPEPRPMAAPEPRPAPAARPFLIPPPASHPTPAPAARPVPIPAPSARPGAGLAAPGRPAPAHRPAPIAPPATAPATAPAPRPMPSGTAPSAPATTSPAVGRSVAPAPAVAPPIAPAAPVPSAPAAPSPPAPAEAPVDYGLEEFGNYYLLEKIAVGGMAELFKARQRGVHNFEKIVAIKRILPHLSDNDEFVRMFIDEAKLAAQLTHPNIVQIFDLGKAGGFYYIAMEFVDGRDLRSLLRKVREYKLPLPEPVAAAVTMKVANALDYAHRERGINDRELKLVHRDISPQNILISYDGAVKLVDFGIAKAATKSTQTMAGALKGKLLYMSPEQALGQKLDGRSDIYSLGLVLFELLTGERCFQADSELGVLEKVRLGKVLDVRSVNPDVSVEMAAILDKALQKNVDQRYLSARMLERDLRALLVKNANEPTEHEVAEYVNTLLKGTRAELVSLLSSQFALPSVPQTHDTVPIPMMSLEDQPTGVEPPRRDHQTFFFPPEPEPAHSGRPVWLLPAMGLLALAAVVLAWWFLHG